MPTTLTPDAELRARLREARGRAREPGTTVFDELQQSSGFDAATYLVRAAGADIVTVAPALDTVQWLSVGDAEVALVADGETGSRLLLSDPWDQAVVDRAQAAVGRYVAPYATTGHVLDALRPRRDASPPLRAGTGDPGASEGVVAFVDSAIVQAYRSGASDIHFECDRQGVHVKLRLDGVMSPLRSYAGRQQAEEVISRIKVLAQLDITERRLPQDGRFRFSQGDMALDLRVSIMPSVFGEDAVLRLLDKRQLREDEQAVTLEALGFGPLNAKSIRRLASLPNGMLLVTGPTGSGKTTTVYAALSEINTGLEKIITIEDPVEYELPGVLQIPVNERKGLTFAKGLRSILRHDPDRILVGEIRDAETAAIAVQSALTGHLVFTTVHANSLFDVVGRFRHFGIDMFGFVSALNGVVVQRLMRSVCPACVGRRRAGDDERAWLAQQQAADLADALPRPTGCPSCHGTGYRGRFVVAEVHQLGDAMRDLIVREAEVSALKDLAFRDDLRTLRQQAIDEIRQGRTTLEELFRVVGQV